MPDLIGKTIGQYRIVGQIGLGGMATVFKAYQPSMDRYVALKVLSTHLAQDTNFIKRFQQEAKIIAKLEHLHILPVYDHGEQDGYLYLVMRFIEAGTLSDRLKRGPLSLEEARRVVSQVGSALEYAHQLGVVHRDIKPSNVLIDPQGDCYLTDFGIAKMVEGTLGLTGSAIIGTPHYMAPEQSQSRTVDHRADVYAMGVVIYEMVTGRVPYDAETPFAVVMKHISEPLPLPRSIRPDLPEAVERVLLSALAKDPADRYQSMRDLVMAFDQAVQTAPDKALAPCASAAREPVAAPALTPTVLMSRRASFQRRLAAQPPWLLPATGLALVVIVLAGVILSRIPGRVEIAGGQVQLVTPTAMAVSVARPTATTASGVKPPAASTAAPATTAIPGVTVPAIPTGAPIPTAAPSVSAGRPTPTSRTWQNWTQVKSFPAPGDEPTSIVRVGDNLWVNVPCSNRIYRLDMEGNLVTELEMPKPGCGPRDVGLAWDGTSLWGTWWNEVVQIDPNNGYAVSDFHADLEGCSIAWDGSSLWVVDRAGNLSAYGLNGQRLRRLAIPVFGVVSAITWVNGELWMLDEFGKVTRFDGDFLEVGSFSLSSACGISSFHQQKSFGLYWDGVNLWVADAVNNRIYQCAPGD